MHDKFAKFMDALTGVLMIGMVVFFGCLVFAPKQTDEFFQRTVYNPVYQIAVSAEKWAIKPPGPDSSFMQRYVHHWIQYEKQAQKTRMESWWPDPRWM